MNIFIRHDRGSRRGESLNKVFSFIWVLFIKLMDYIHNVTLVTICERFRLNFDTVFVLIKCYIHNYGRMMLTRLK